MLGGARSGKSRFAEGLAASLGGEDVLYVATAMLDLGDPELEDRVAAHRERRPPGWGLLELGGGSLTPVNEAAQGRGAVLVDSLTLWVSARMLQGAEGGTVGEVEGFLEAATGLEVPIVVVSDEVGLGTVPEGAEARRFRDLLGLGNERVAAAAEEVYLCVAGIPCRIK